MSKRILRPIDFTDPGEAVFFAFKGTKSTIKNAFKPKDPKDVPLLLKNLRKIMVGLRICSDGKYIYKREGKEPIFKIPDSIDSCKKAARFMEKYHSLPYTDAFCSIGYNNKLVCFNSQHLCCDATVSRMIAKHCLDENLECDIECPVSAAAEIKEVLKKYLPNIEKYKDQMIPDLKNTLISPDGRDPTPERNIIFNEFPSSKLQCYDHKLKRPVGLTNNLWVALSLTSNTLENKFNYYSVMSAMNLRPFLKGAVDNWKYLNAFAITSVAARNPTMNTTIKELGQQFRENYNFVFKNGLILDRFIHRLTLPYPFGVYLGLSSLGPIHFHEKLDDVSFYPSFDGIGSESIITFNDYLKIKKDSSIYCSSIKYPTEALTRKKVNIINDSINHILCDIPLDTKLSDVIPELRDFQQKLYKEY